MFESLIAKFERLGDRALYPYGPLVFVPLLILSFGAVEVAMPGTMLDDGSVAIVSLLAELAEPGEVRAAASTVVVLPETLKSARLALTTERGFRVLVSEEPETVRINQALYQLDEDGLTVETAWFRAKGPLVFLIEGASIREVEYRGREQGDAPGELELPPIWSQWIMLGTFLPALFGLGFASAFVKDLAPVRDQEARRDEGDLKTQH